MDHIEQKIVKNLSKFYQICLKFESDELNKLQSIFDQNPYNDDNIKISASLRIQTQDYQTQNVLCQLFELDFFYLSRRQDIYEIHRSIKTVREERNKLKIHCLLDMYIDIKHFKVYENDENKQTS